MQIVLWRQQIEMKSYVIKVNFNDVININDVNINDVNINDVNINDVNINDVKE